MVITVITMLILVTSISSVSYAASACYCSSCRTYAAVHDCRPTYTSDVTFDSHSYGFLWLKTCTIRYQYNEHSIDCVCGGSGTGSHLHLIQHYHCDKGDISGNCP